MGPPPSLTFLPSFRLLGERSILKERMPPKSTNMEIATSFEAVKFIGTHGRSIGQGKTVRLNAKGLTTLRQLGVQ